MVDIYNKYHARSETQFKFAERIEKELGIICNFGHYYITRGRGWSCAGGSCSSQVEIQGKNGGETYRWLLLYHPLKDYLVKKKYLSAWEDDRDICLEIENIPPKKNWFEEIQLK